jgi:hypothetical protein
VQAQDRCGPALFIDAPSGFLKDFMDFISLHRAVTLIFVPHTEFTQIPAAASDNLFYGRHRYIVRKGWKKEGEESRHRFGKLQIRCGLR